MNSYPISIRPLTINVPARQVWDILINFEQYSNWNPFTPRVETSCVVGDPVIVYVNEKHNKPAVKRAFILDQWDEPQQIAWSMPKIIHRKVFNAHRTQTITPIDQDSCSYTTVDTFRGWLAKAIYQARGEWVEKNLTDLANALKKYAESQRQ